MLHSAEDLQQLRGVGSILAKRLYDAGFDSFDKIVAGGEDGLRKVRGVPSRAVASILEQAKKLAAAPAGHPEREAALKKQLDGVRGKVLTLAEDAHDRFKEKLTGKSGKKMAADLTRIQDALGQLEGSGKKRSKKRSKALTKAEKRVDGLEGAPLKKIRKSLKRARKAVQKAV